MCVKERRFEVNVTTFQALILLLFNDSDDLTFADLQKATGIDPKVCGPPARNGRGGHEGGLAGRGRGPQRRAFPGSKPRSGGGRVAEPCQPPDSDAVVCARVYGGSFGRGTVRGGGVSFFRLWPKIAPPPPPSSSSSRNLLRNPGHFSLPGSCRVLVSSY